MYIQEWNVGQQKWKTILENPFHFASCNKVPQWLGVFNGQLVSHSSSWCDGLQQYIDNTWKNTNYTIPVETYLNSNIYSNDVVGLMCAVTGTNPFGKNEAFFC
jgi:hypothetical protein